MKTFWGDFIISGDKTLWFGQSHKMYNRVNRRVNFELCLIITCERVIDRKARGLQTEEIGCKCQTFFISL